MSQSLSARYVGKVFDGRGRVVALRDVNMEVPGGGFAAIIGPSGCGKSTLLRIFADLLQPTTGTVAIGGGAPQNARRTKSIGFVFQSATLLPWRTIRRNVELPLDVAGERGRSREGRADALLSLVGLDGFGDSLPHQLSGGMQQRAAIARALILKPEILLLDEPFGALDEITRQRMNLELLRIWGETKTTAVLVTHSIAEAVLMADRVFVMTPRPGTIAKAVDVPLERPRTLQMMRTPAFFDVVNELRDALFGTETEPALEPLPLEAVS
ncbi:ABC transporter ATP-binding protein [Acuticoccus sp. M5D2P5]|uniref:ABC transporter ATP-binding protein n=1 Tax=Acuticoccus kalidii TaxID=2910977 RepID=UPI001F38F529|nr:ABC transporter ATP-binding protein [Acuticoccus kalidii]MCF3932946.1 ABC transporter ATP-binding protein [Acuticoccus kalidii]